MFQSSRDNFVSPHGRARSALVVRRQNTCTSGRRREREGEEEQKILNHCQYGLKSPGSLPKLQRTTNGCLIVSVHSSGGQRNNKLHEDLHEASKATLLQLHSGLWAGQTAQCWRAPASLAVDSDSVPSTHVVAHEHLEQQFQGIQPFVLTSADTRHTCGAGKTLMHEQLIRDLKRF